MSKARGMTHDERVYHHELETLEGIHEHAERIATMEELIEDMAGRLRAADGLLGGGFMDARFIERIEALGMEA